MTVLVHTPTWRHRYSRGAVLAIAILAGIASSSGERPLAAQAARTASVPPLQLENRAAELRDRHERQIRAGLIDEAAATAQQLEDMTRAQIAKCGRWWELSDRATKGELAASQQLSKAFNVSEFVSACYWRPGQAADQRPGQQAAEQSMRAVSAQRVEHDTLGARTPLFVEPALSTTIDFDLSGALFAGYTAATMWSPELTPMSVEFNRLVVSAGDFAAADETFARMLSIVQRSAVSSPGAVAFVFGLRRGTAERRADLPAALRHAREEIEFLDSTYGAASAHLCPPLWHLASLFMSSKEPDRAIEAATRCLTNAASRGAASVTYASALNNVGVVHHRNGAVARAVDAYQQSLAAFQRNPSTMLDQATAVQRPLIPVYANLGLASWQLGDVAQAYHYMQLARLQMGREGELFVTEHGAVEGMAKLSSELDVLITVELAATTSATDAPMLALPMLLERKSLALSGKATTVNMLASSPGQLAEYRSLLAGRSALARRSAGTPDARAAQRRLAAVFDLQIRTLEAAALERSTTATTTAVYAGDPRTAEYTKALVKESSKRYEDYYRRPPKGDRRSDIEIGMDIQRQAVAAIAPRFKDYLNAQQARLRGSRETLLPSIQSRLPDTAALIEIVRFRPFKTTASTDADRWAPARYGAYLIRRVGTPRFIDYGEAATIDDLVVEFRRTLAQPSGTLVRELGRRLDAVLMQPIRQQLGAATQIYVSPDGALNLVPFGALVDEQDRYLLETYTFNYLPSGRDLTREVAVATAGGPAVVIANPAFDGQLSAVAPVAERSGPPTGSRSALGIRFEPLPGTAAEGQAITSILGNAEVFTGGNATETALKRVAAPRLLHIATHGFFLEDHDSAAAPDTGGSLLDDPMLRSGLVFAGVNQDRSGTDDGVLTALEAAGLGLAGTQLVVLSACDTGVGDIKGGEGVFGLRRAFMVAGAETLVMSLWQVDDEATEKLMVDFYRRLARGDGRADALRQAALTLLHDPARRHPFYWASFIATGEVGPLRR